MAVTGFASGIKRLDGAFLDGPAAASTSCYRMAIVMRDASGNLKNGATASGCHGVGVAAYNDAYGTDSNVWDNSSGSAGDVRVKYLEGIYGPFANSSTSIAVGDEGKVCYIVDNVTVHATSNSGARSPAGLIHKVTSDGVYVEFDEMDVRIAAANNGGTTFTQTYSTASTTVAALTASALTDNSGGATADGTIGVVTAPTALTDSTTGVASTTLAAITSPTAVTDNSGGSASDTTLASITTGGGTYPDATPTKNAIAKLAVLGNANAAAVILLKNDAAQFAASQAQNRAAIVALTDAVKELSTAFNLLRADALSMKQNDNAIIDVEQAANIAG